LVLNAGAFDVADQPSRSRRLDPALGYRVDVMTQTPVCVHPFRVGIPPGRYASADEPLVFRASAPDPAQLVTPQNPEDLEAWIVATLGTVGSDAMDSALERVESIASQQFAPHVVLAALRRALSELAGH
jgi:hypothetical protein